jgi:chromosome segregation ATPase
MKEKIEIVKRIRSTERQIRNYQKVNSDVINRRVEVLNSRLKDLKSKLASL